MFKFVYGALIVVALLIARGFNSVAFVGQQDSQAVIAVSYGAEDTGAIDIYVDQTLVVENFSSSDSTVYIQVAAGDHLLDVVPAGEQIVMMKTTEMDFEAGHTYQLLFTHSMSQASLEIMAIDETIE